MIIITFIEKEKTWIRSDTNEREHDLNICRAA